MYRSASMSANFRALPQFGQIDLGEPIAPAQKDYVFLIVMGLFTFALFLTGLLILLKSFGVIEGGLGLIK